ncbi:glycoside hydrolase family 15 protein [Granulicella cerasi]|uniref:Glycoside hydrolase family 15 protein n=1 Tax=Granulicella cerasi TaxID=741063 RepID=A0ABW1ZER4_9BACT|nr:glycoside hydrolase family 15 protein [Granulicella cerasi]
MSLDLNEYAIIGDMRTCALVSRHASIDWLCMPRFDSPAILLKLLDDDRGGSCEVDPGEILTSTRRYVEGTNILETTLETTSGVLRITDFFDVQRHSGGELDSRSEHRCMRLLECTEGDLDVTIRFRPTFGFATCSHSVRAESEGFIYSAEDADGTVLLGVQWSEGVRFVRHDSWHVPLRAGERCWFMIQHRDTAEPLPQLRDQDVDEMLRRTEAYWLEWSSRCTYKGRWEGAILRSILCLKLLTYAPTGAIAAAATCGLPEVIGGERNWDYRFCWLRDASFTVSSFLNCGYRHEARRFLDFIAQRDPSCGKNLQVLYPLCEGSAGERILRHLKGWKRSTPVRIGNAASDQVQLDIYGEYMSALAMYLEDAPASEVEEMRERVEQTVRNVLSFIEGHWQSPDQGLWELQVPPQQHLHSKGMCFVAIGRGLKLAAQLGMSLDVQHWRHLQNRIRQDYLRGAWSNDAQALMQTYDHVRLDASAMRLVLYEALDCREEQTKATVAAIQEALCEGDLVYRYKGDDGLPGQEGCFTVCSFWLASMHAYQGNGDQAIALFERMLGRANDVGLFSEEMLPETFEQIGNFPQAFTHMGVINNGQRILRLLGEQP